jgi:hypothetical protein
MTEAEKQLLTAYLDGVLSAAEKERAELLLRTSVEARQLFSDLVSDSLRLKYLRREQLPTDFADRVVAILREEVARLARRQLWRLRIRRWAPVAVAAALLPFIAWGTFALLSQILTRPESPSVASSSQSQPQQQDFDRPGPVASDANQLAKHSWAELEQKLRTGWQESVRAGESWQQLFAQSIEPLNELARAAWNELEPLVLGDWNPAVPDIGNPAVLTSPLRDTNRQMFRSLEFSLPPIFSWQNFGQNEVQQLLGTKRFLVLDVSCRDGRRTWERVQAAFRSQKIPVLLDSRLKKFWDHHQNTVFFVYVENLSRAQAGDLLLALHREDTRGAGKSPSEAQIRSILAQPVVPEVRQRLAELLGLPTGLLPEADTSPSPAADSAVADDTLRKLEQLAAGQPVRPAVTQAVAFSPLRYPPSKEIQRFRQQRGQVRADAYHLVLIFRPER